MMRIIYRSGAPVVMGELTLRHHVYAKTSHKDVQLAEVGPRFEAKRRWS
jgi:rRNA maturation protein Rpf1